ncbi:hypothetical protein G6F36_015267 [Rhizopus arrhizus]|nr:hypothetical protein G6F36_015267 [Rhizopus arrhizus]
MSDHQELLDDIIYFARAGDLEELQSSKPEPKLLIEKDETGKTALHMASANNHLGNERQLIHTYNTY